MIECANHLAGALEGSQGLLREVRGAFIAKGATLTGWCRAHGIDHAHAHRVLRGVTNGPNAQKLRSTIVSAARNA